MSFSNPTPLRVGMTGNLGGNHYRVAGRIVMGMDDGGTTYYWNEFNLLDDAGETVTLVFEETESGGQWRLFKLFEPQHPLTAAEAVTKRVGDRFDFGEGQARVTLVDESRVYHIEGEAPEGVELGDIARYFNAEAGNKTIVVSWTGDEVEYFRGADLSSATVMSAFGLRADTPDSLGSLGKFRSSQAGGAPPMPLAVKLIGAFMITVVLFASYASCRPQRQRPAVTRTSAPASLLTIGSSGSLDGKTYRITGHAMVGIAQVGSAYERHEYLLADDAGNQALLVYGLKPGAKDWALFTPLQMLNPLTPVQAAALRTGETVNLNGYVAPVSELFQATFMQLDPEPSQTPAAKRGDVYFGFGARSGATLLLARWNDRDITCFSGKALPEKDVIAAFALEKRN